MTLTATGKVAVSAIAALIVVAIVKVVEYAPGPPNWTDKNRFDTRPRR